jgi:RimJ/RimL family protein N-acetyltransferase
MPVDFRRADPAGRPFLREGFQLRQIDLGADVATLHRWFTLPYAGFWGMQDKSEHQVRDTYAQLVASGHAMAYIGLEAGESAFLVECYDPAHDPLGALYPVAPGDVGMHFFVGPPQVPRHGHTRRVFRCLMQFIFERLHARRVVVEPDVRNDKVHVLNRAMGFDYHGTVALPEKLAALAFCTRAQFVGRQTLATQREELIP